MSEIVTETLIPIYDSFDATVITEMASGASVLLPLSEEEIKAVAQDDPDPKFATFLIESGWSRQKNYWGPEVFTSVQEQINNSSEPIVGYLGHIKPEDDGFSFPDIQLQWLKSKLQVSSDRVRMLVKAYALPETKGRDYLKRGLVRTVSWRGDAVKKPIKGGSAISDFKLESIDLSRPRKAGMSAAMVGGLTSEMDEGRQDVKPEEIKALQENELRAHNLELVTEIEDNAKKPLEEKITEQTAAAETTKTQLELLPEIRKLLELPEDGDILDVLGKTMTQLKDAGKTVKDSIIDKVLARKFKDEKTRGLVRRIMASEMYAVDFVGDAEKDEKAISEKVNEMVDADEEIKSLVSEMEENNGNGDGERGSSQSRSERGAPREIKAGFENANLTVRQARR